MNKQKERNEIRMEINEMESKITIQQINKTKI
jgi:hypothetical protein